MRDALLAYLLNDLDDEQRCRVETRLASDPIWQHELERLRSLMDANEPNPGDAPCPPEDLVHRTCSFVKQASAQGSLAPYVLPASLSESQGTAPPRSKRWSLLDLGVAASILLVLGTLLLPALRESRDTARRLQCQSQLQQLGSALASYAAQNGGQLPSIGRDENAGMYALKLLESGVLTRPQLIELLVCPSTPLAKDVFNGKVLLRVPTRAELASATGAVLPSLLEQMGGSFAYRIGYFDEQGNYHQVNFVGSPQAPMMADKPSYQVVGFQSANHGGCGQNVLFQDLSVRYVQICRQNDPDEHWFLNQKGKHAAGIGRHDVVMIRSEARPTGPLGR